MDGSTEMTTHLDAPPARVWTALTDADALAAWYWPASLRPAVVSEPRAGGRFAVTAQAAEMGFAGVYEQFEPPRRMVQSWRWAGEERTSRVTVDLVPAGGGTDLVVVHDRLDADQVEPYRAGWESCLARLPGHLA